MPDEDRTTIGMVGSVYLEHPVSGYRLERFDRVIQALRECSLTMANFEGCVQGDGDWPVFVAGAVGSGSYMGGLPSTIDEMKYMGIDAVYAANNHATDFGERGILTTVKELRARNMPYAGIGASLTEASAPCYMETPGGRRVALISVTDWGPRGPMDMLFPWPFGYMASDELPPYTSRPGVNLLRYDVATRVDRQTIEELRRASNYLGWEKYKALRRTGMMRDYPVIYGQTPDCEVDTDDEFYFMGRKFVVGDEPGADTTAFTEDLDRIVKFVKEARRQADIVVVALHDQSLGQDGFVHEYMRTAAFASLEAGADIFVNHGGLQRGIEIVDGKVILWGLSSFFLHNNQITRLPSSSYAYWGLPADSTVADLLEVRANRAKPKAGSPQEKPLYPLMPASLYSVEFDMANRARAVRVQPFSLDQSAPMYRKDMPLWPEPDEAEDASKQIAVLSEPYNTDVRIENGTVVARIR